MFEIFSRATPSLIRPLNEEGLLLPELPEVPAYKK